MGFIENLKVCILKLPMGEFLWRIFFIIIPLSAFLYYFSSVLAPFICAIVLAYILSSLNKQLVSKGCSAKYSMYLVIFGLVLVFGGVATYLAPIIVEQSVNFAKDLPSIYIDVKERVFEVSLQYFGEGSSSTLLEIFDQINQYVTAYAGIVANNTLGSLGNITLIALYIIIVPLLAYFFVKDSDKLLSFFSRFIKSQNTTSSISYYWSRIDGQLSNYIQGKLLEILIVGVVSFALFALFGLQYAALLATAVGLSVLVPYVGAFSVSVPIACVALAQWGVSVEAFSLIGCYMILQILDGNILVPLIFSEKMKLHPVAILFAVFIFGYAGGVIGVFFSIPLLALIKVYIDKHYPAL